MLLTLTAIDMTNNAVQGQLFSGQVASFLNDNRQQPADQFDATIDWGDGTTTTGQVADSSTTPGLYLVSGAHVFTRPGTFNGSVTLTQNFGEPPVPTATAKSTFFVTPPNLVVTNTNDSGRGSLRNAINLANTIQDGTITFAVTSPEPHVLHLLSPLPVIFTTVTIDTTIPAPVRVPPPPAPFIIDGRGAQFPPPDSEGARDFPALLDVDAPNCVIRGLTVQGSMEFGIVVDIDGAGSRITGNFIGTNEIGTATSPAIGNDLGGLIVVSANNMVDHNVVSGNGGSGQNTTTNPGGSEGFGIGLIGTGAHGNLITNNRIGTDSSGTSALPNFDGIDVNAGSENTIVSNTIAGNREAGVYLYNGASSNLLQRNDIGLNASGGALGNQVGVAIADSAGNRIGGPTANDGNRIGGNSTSGVVIFNSFVPGTHGTKASTNVIAFNTIQANGQNGVYILNASNNQVGISTTGTTSSPGSASGTATGGNLIQNNGLAGVQISLDAVPGSQGLVPSGAEATGNVVINNIVQQNRNDGIYLFNATGNLIGIAANGLISGNTVRGNAQSAVLIDGFDANQNQVAGNLLANSGLFGVLINNGTQNVIGGSGSAANLIQRNGIAGFQVLRNGLPLPNHGLGGNIFAGNTGSQAGPAAIRAVAPAHTHPQPRPAGHHPTGPLHHSPRKTVAARRALHAHGRLGRHPHHA